MIILFSMWLLAALAAAACGTQLDFSTALLAWAGLAAISCAIGAWLISRQPLGTATAGGRFGSSFVHWGFRAGRGQLAPAALISWAVWLVIGSAIIGSVQCPQHSLITVAWTADFLSLFYVIGIMAANRGSGRLPASLVKLGCAVLGMLGGSFWMWFGIGTDRAQATALTLAGGPLLLIGIGYGFMLAMTGLMGRRVRWN